jgi:hypothetical protein
MPSAQRQVSRTLHSLAAGAATQMHKSTLSSTIRLSVGAIAVYVLGRGYRIPTEICRSSTADCQLTLAYVFQVRATIWENCGWYAPVRYVNQAVAGFVIDTANFVAAKKERLRLHEAFLTCDTNTPSHVNTHMRIEVCTARKGPWMQPYPQAPMQSVA